MGDQDGIAEVRRQRHMVFSRSSACRPETLRQGGWWQSLHARRTGTRRTARRSVVTIRVDHVEVLEQGRSSRLGFDGCEDQVYNLQVEGNQNYFAEDILVHNCHLIAPDDEGMYRQFLADAKVVNPNVRLIGLTATPFRMKSGMICEPDNLLNAVCCEVGVKELIAQGYLCPLVTKAGLKKVDTSTLHMRAGEFVVGEVEDLMDQDELVEAACREIIS